MKTKTCLTLLIAIMLVSMMPSIGRMPLTKGTNQLLLATPVHNINTGLKYTTIQAAIDAPETLDGHTLRCDAGNYTEQVRVTKSLKIIGSGQSASYIVTPEGEPYPFDISVTKSNVTIEGFTIVTRSGFSGVVVSTPAIGSDGTIGLCTFAGNGSGVLVSGSGGNVIGNNTFYSLPADAITLTDSSQRNKITGNILNKNHYGIQLRNGSNYNVIANNFVNSSALDGIRLNWQGSSYAPVMFNNITCNELTNNYDGIFLDSSSKNILVQNNTATGNYIGVRLRQANSSTIVSNKVIANTYRGISAESSYSNRLYNNFFNNTVNAWDNGANSWNTTKQAGSNIIGGSYIAGNYWSDNPHPTDANHDGLGDVPYSITGGVNVDYLPLVGSIFPIPLYSATIAAYDWNPPPQNPKVKIWQQGLGWTNHLTTSTFNFLFGTNYFAVLTADPLCHVFDYWILGSAIVSSTVKVAVSHSGLYTAYYGNGTCPFLNVTIAAKDSLHGNVDPHVSILEDGYPTYLTTTQNFLLIGSPHTFTVPFTDAPTYNDPFTIWIPIWFTTTKTVTTSGLYTAYYGNRSIPYNVTIKAWDLSRAVWLSVPITDHGSLPTPHTFYNMVGTNYFTVPMTDTYLNTFVYWTGGLPNPKLTVTQPGTYIAYYANTTGWLFNCTITAHDIPVGKDVSVPITDHGNLPTPQTFYLVSSPQYFTVPAVDGYGNPFVQWSTGVKSRTLQVNWPGGIFTAYYGSNVTPIHYVNFTNVALSKTVIPRGSSQNVTVTIVNPGNYAETLYVTLYANSTPIASQSADLPSGNCTTLILLLNTTGLARGSYTISADMITSEPLEISAYWKKEKPMTVTINGDANGDGTVNVLDLILIAIHLGIIGGGSYAPYSLDWYKCMNTDMNNDGQHNVLDLIICAVNLGAH